MRRKVAATRAALLVGAGALLWLSGFALGGYHGFAARALRAGKSIVYAGKPSWDDPKAGSWPSGFRAVSIGTQGAYARQATGTQPRPLIISLHTWSGSYRQSDPLAAYAEANNWNYLHPDFEGPNDHPDACLSDKVMADLDGSIDYAERQWHVDPSNIVIVGASGGGYATIGAYLKLQHPVRAYLAWAPISDLAAWYRESSVRKNDYGKKLIACTTGGNSPDFATLAARSPLTWPNRTSSADLEIFAGLNDGYTGSVPISHSINFFNKVALANPVPAQDMSRLLSRDVAFSSERISDRTVFYRRDSGNVHLTIFDGTHEMLTDYAAQRIAGIVSSASK